MPDSALTVQDELFVCARCLTHVLFWLVGRPKPYCYRCGEYNDGIPYVRAGRHALTLLELRAPQTVREIVVRGTVAGQPVERVYPVPEREPANDIERPVRITVELGEEMVMVIRRSAFEQRYQAGDAAPTDPDARRNGAGG